MTSAHRPIRSLFSKRKLFASLLARRVWLGVVAVVVFGGLAAFGLPVVVGVGMLGGGSQQFQSPSSVYERANALYRHATGQSAYFGVDVLLRRDAGSVDAVSGRRALTGMVLLLERQRGYERVFEPAVGAGRERVVMAAFARPADSAAAVAHLRAVVFSEHGHARAGLDGWSVAFGGPDVAFSALQARTSSDVEHVEIITIPLLLLLCFFVFRGVAMVLPVLVGGCASVLALAVLRLLEQIGVAISVYCLPAVLGLAFGLGLDYSWLLVGRYREELSAGAVPSVAVARTSATAGRTVLLSSVTVALALVGSLVVFRLEFLRSIGIAAAITALVSGVAAQVIVPRLLPRVAGLRLDLAPAFIVRRWRALTGQGMWEWLADRVTRRPALVAVLAGGVLLAAGLPVLGLRLVAPSAQLLPAAAESRRVEHALAADFTSDPAGDMYTLYRPHGHGPSVAALAGIEARIAGGRAEVARPRYLGSDTWELGLLPRGLPDSAANQRLLARLRAGTAASGALIGGFTAFFVDQRAAIIGHLGLAVLILGVVAFVMLWVASGSVVIPVKAIVMALLSVFAGIGILVAVFGGLEEADLIFLVALALALSIDYEIFLISRIREERTSGLSNRAAIAAGLARTGPLISAAALLFCFSVGAFGLAGSLPFTQEFGVGAAVTVAVDACVVRAFLVPALMVKLGEWNWWAPTPLRQLWGRIEIHEHPRDSTLRHRGRVTPSAAAAANRLGQCSSAADKASEQAGGC